MAPPSQKADQRPISFVFHNQAIGSEPVEVKLVIRPEELVRNEPSRLMTHQTLGGAWADSFGAGVPTVSLNGHTGWGAGNRPSGLDEFQNLHGTIFKRWHEERAYAVDSGLDPDKVKLIFHDKLDDFTWVVAPQSFVLRRSKTRPLLAQYQISLTWLSDDVAESIFALSALGWDDDVLTSLGLDSLENSLRMIDEFASELAANISNFLGAINDQVAGFVNLTARALKAVQSVIASGMKIVDATTNGLIAIATNLTRAAANICRTITAIVTLPQRIQARFSMVAAAFTNAHCVMTNAFRKRTFLPDYSGLYGASTCSSTAGGSPISRYANSNPFPILFPTTTSQFSVSQSAAQSLDKLVKTDVVLNPMSSGALNSCLVSVNSELVLTA